MQHDWQAMKLKRKQLLRALPLFEILGELADFIRSKFSCGLGTAWFKYQEQHRQPELEATQLHDKLTELLAQVNLDTTVINQDRLQ